MHRRGDDDAIGRIANTFALERSREHRNLQRQFENHGAGAFDGFRNPRQFRRVESNPLFLREHRHSQNVNTETAVVSFASA